jgi:hypothetical protein
MKKLFSLKELMTQSRITLSRFPLTFVFALVSAVLAIVLIENEILDPWWVHINVILLLGLPLFTALHVWLENLSISTLKKQLIIGGGVGLMALLIFEIPYIKMLPQSFALHFFGFAILFHLLAAFLPFFRSNSIQAFWQFNKTMFLRFLLGALYSAVLYGGLSLALLALQFLLEMEIHEKIWIDLLLIIGLPFNTIFFLGGLPTDVLSLEEDRSFPNGLKKFVQYVLMPLVVIYLSILYVYSAKISFLTELPQGWVTYLILAFAIAGMLALLLISPLQQDEKSPWVKWYTKGYYWALWPLIILLFVAISTRFLEYGWTENRVIIFGLALWLAGITAYFTFLKRTNIISIPLSLFVLVAVLLLGPLSAENVAKRSQRNRLNAILTDQKWMDENGKILSQKIRTSTNDSIKYELSQTIEFLAGHFGNNGLEGFLPVDTNLAPENDENEYYSFMGHIEEEWDLPASNTRGIVRNIHSSKWIHINYQRKEPNIIPLFGAQFAHRLNFNSKYKIENQQLICDFDGEITRIDLKKYFDRFPKNLKGDDYQMEDMDDQIAQIPLQIRGKKVVLFLNQISINYLRKTGEIDEVSVDDGFVFEF